MADPREIFPEEVWNLILNGVDDPKDIHSCSQTCTLFQSRFSPNLTNWAFPLIFPSLLKVLTKSDILQCRLVSKDWRNGVDKFLQSDKFAPTLVQQLSQNENPKSSILTRISNIHVVRINQRGFAREIHFPLRINPIQGNLVEIINNQQRDYQDRVQQIALLNGGIQIPLNVDRLGGERGQGRAFIFGAPNLELPDVDAERVIQVQNVRNDCQQFMLSFENTTDEKNPFPSRAVVLEVKSSDIEQTLEFLEAFGKHIWSLKLVVQMQGSTAYQELQLIWKVLKCVPNLKHLYLGEKSGHYNLPNRNHEMGCEIWNNFLDTNAPLVLQQLRWVQLDKKCVNISYLLVKALGSRFVTIFEKNGYIKPCHISNNWKSLSLQINKCSTRMAWNAHIRSFKHLNLQLESMDLQYSKCEDFQVIFDNLSKYGFTLRSLTLTFNNLEIQELAGMRNQVDAMRIFLICQMTSLESFNMVVNCAGSGSTTEFRQFVDSILDADWIEKYLEMGGVISGFRRLGFACISAGMHKKAEGSSKLKPKYITNGRHFRSLEAVPQESN